MNFQAEAEPGALIFLDEMSTNCSMARDYGRSPRGERCHAHKPKNWGDNITVIGALSLAGVEAVMTLNGALTQQWFTIWVRKFLVPILRPGDVVILDNSSAHKGAPARQLIEEAGARVAFLPAYSPDMNPIEQTWSKLKALIRSRAPRTRDDLEDVLAWAMEQVSSQDALGWMLHSGYRTWLD